MKILKTLSFFVLIFIPFVVSIKIEYPNVRRDDKVSDDYFGTTVKDPYRWLEDTTSPEVTQFIEAQNKLTSQYVDQPIRKEIHKVLTEAYNYKRYKNMRRQGSRYTFLGNKGTQNQDVLYIQDTLTSEPRVFLDPNTLSEDGSISVQQTSFSGNGELAAYAMSKKGSDWLTVRIRNVSTGLDFPEVLGQIKYSNFEWTKDNLGFFYARYPGNKEMGDAVNGTETNRVSNQKLYYHRVGTNQESDTLVVEFPEHPDWLIGGVDVTEEGNYLLVYPSAGASEETMVYYANIVTPLKNGFKEKLNLIPVISKLEANYVYVTNDGSVIYFVTNKGAPNSQIMGIDLNRPEERYWSEVVPEDSKKVLKWASPVNRDKIVLVYIEDTKSKLELRFLGNGSLIHDFPLDIGTVSHFSSKRDHDEFFFNFVSFLTPGKLSHVDLTKNPIRTTVVKETVAPGFNSSEYTVKQVFYPSKDGTQVPMFILHLKDYIHESNSPTYMFANGEFRDNILPSFLPERIVFLKNFRGVVAIPNVRGDGGYGSKWHDGGRRLNKQNSFDDFQYAAKYLIHQNYTVPSKIAINGASHGGFVIGACVNQAPELFGAAVTQVGLFDLLRFQKFTIGYAWCPEYGCSDQSQITFENLYKLSPLHNVRIPKNESVQYPSILLMTGDHDDQVVSLHSFKFAAELQYSVGRSNRQTNPLLLKVSPSVGQGSGKPTSVKISEFADIFTFFVQALGIKFYS